jgi:simple sugar transport system permease protein
MALAIGAVGLIFMGVNPIFAYLSLLDGAFGSITSIGDTIAKTVPLLLAGLGITVAFRSGVWNIGAEGQIYFGALIGTLAALFLREVSNPLLLPFVLALGFLGGSMWAAVPGVLKAKFEVNEVITTLMMNFISILAVSHLVAGPLRDVTILAWPQTEIIPSSAWLPKLIPGTALHSGILIGLLFVALVHIFLFKTTLGYQIRIMGAQPKTARYGGINITKNIVIVMILSGGLAGLAGMCEISGVHYRLKDAFSPNYGYTAILVSLLGKNNPWGVALAAFLFGSLIVGGSSMQRITGVPMGIVVIVESLIAMFFLISTQILAKRR